MITPFYLSLWNQHHLDPAVVRRATFSNGRPGEILDVQFTRAGLVVYCIRDHQGVPLRSLGLVASDSRLAFFHHAGRTFPYVDFNGTEWETTGSPSAMIRTLIDWFVQNLRDEWSNVALISIDEVDPPSPGRSYYWTERAAIAEYLQSPQRSGVALWGGIVEYAITTYRLAAGDVVAAIRLMVEEGTLQTANARVGDLDVYLPILALRDGCISCKQSPDPRCACQRFGAWEIEKETA